MPLAIRVENLSKQYRLGQIGTGTLSHDLNRFWARLRGKEDPYARIGAANDRTQKASSDYVWALKDINFEVEQGDAVGIIGRNGAGKSTLLKILSRTTLPTIGTVKMKGRIASLLEVGTGFHPEMTGRENIYQNGAILGMTRHEIKRKFDEIVDFSGCEAYIDTPVKRYSSGMYVRLAFAVAAHLESEILIVDEVLAVGDAEFQKKCLGKMNDVAKGEGRTVLFVSHNLGSISELCKYSILMENGILVKYDMTHEVLDLYKNNLSNTTSNYIKEDGFIKRVSLKSMSSTINYSEKIELLITINNTFSGENALIGLAMLDKWKRKIFTKQTNIIKGKTNYSLTIPSKTFLQGEYSFDVAVFIQNSIVFEYLKDISPIEIFDFESENATYGDADIGILNINAIWE